MQTQLSLAEPFTINDTAGTSQTSTALRNEFQQVCAFGPDDSGHTRQLKHNWFRSVNLRDLQKRFGIRGLENTDYPAAHNKSTQGHVSTLLL